MSIYKPTWLYIKHHNQTGLKYFGMTRCKCVNSYRGSGKYWKLHLQKHGNDVSTTWTKLYEDESELIAYAAHFSTVNDIVKSAAWANLVPESGIYGKSASKGWHHTDEYKKKMSALRKGCPGNSNMLGKHHTVESKAKCSATLSGRKRPNITPRAKTWNITNLLTGENEIVYNFGKWCDLMGWSRGSAHRNVMRGKPYRHYSIIEVTPYQNC